MKTLTKVLGVLAIAGALTGMLGYTYKNNMAFAVGAAGTAVCSVGYVLAKSKENEKNSYIKK